MKINCEERKLIKLNYEGVHPKLIELKKRLHGII